MSRWEELQNRLMTVVKTNGGPERFTDGTISVHFMGDYVSVEMGTYSVPTWPRNVQVGEFDTEDKAYEATVKLVEKAEQDRWDFA